MPSDHPADDVRKIFDEDVDDLEQIWNQQDVTNLCWQLYRLIREYLAFRTGSKNGVLVLQIDDVDLSTGRAHRILEDIRRYLFVPQVVVLLAVDMSQLEGAVEQNFIKEFSDSLRNHGIVGLDDCHDMMERYLDKLLPSTKQVHLVNVNDEIKRSYHGLQIRYLHRDAMDNEDETTANLLIKYLDLEKDDPKLNGVTKSSFCTCCTGKPAWSFWPRNICTIFCRVPCGN